MIDNKKAPEIESLNKLSKSIISQDIKAMRRFVGYNSFKIPINPINGMTASPTNPNTWADYETAMSCIKKFNQVIGIGIVLGTLDNKTLCGLDIDNCIDTNENISKEAQDIIDLFNTYTELSPSGRGVHLLFFASKQGDKCKITDLEWCKCLEMYDKDRYFTLTENSINGKSIEYRQKECNEVYEKYFETRKKEAISIKSISTKLEINDNKKLEIGLEKDRKLKAYYQGERFFSDESLNDNGFMSKLMFWTNNNDALAIDTFLNSPYAMTKDEMHKQKLLRKDYLQRTAQRCRHSMLGGHYGKL